MIKVKKLFLLLLVLLVLPFLASCKKTDSKKTNNTQKNFNSFTDDLFLTEVQRDTLTLNYSLSNWADYGIVANDIKIGHFTPAYIENTLSIYENYLKLLGDFKYKDLDHEQQLTYDILDYYFDLELSQGDLILYHDVLGPTTGVQAQLPVLLAEYRIKSVEDLEVYISLVKSTKEYFQEVCEFQRLKSESGLFMTSHVANSIISQCEDFIRNPEENFLIATTNNKISNLEILTEEEKSKYIKDNKDAIVDFLIPSYELLVDTLKDLVSTGKNDKGLCYYEKGKDFYEYLIAYNTNSNKPIPELIQMIDGSIEENIIAMGDILIKDPGVYQELMDASFPLEDPSEIITYLQTAILKNFPEIPNVTCTISYVPEPLQKHLSPAMYLLPAIDDYKNNVIYINPEYDMTDVFPTMAHEGYPGHLYQSVYFRNSNSTPIRNLLNFGGYVEGWATYVEYYSYYLAEFEENVSDFIIANMVTNMGIYCRLDMGIHYEGWDLNKVHKYLENLGIKDKNLSSVLFETIIEEPGLYPQYGIGYLEIIDLKNKAKNISADQFVLKDFHEFILEIGPAPFPIIEDRLDKEFQNFTTRKKPTSVN